MAMPGEACLAVGAKLASQMRLLVLVLKHTAFRRPTGHAQEALSAPVNSWQLVKCCYSIYSVLGQS